MRMKPLPKLLIALTVLGGSIFTWKHFHDSGKLTELAHDAQTEIASNTVIPDSKDPVGSKSNPLKVSIVSFHGYAPALLANGNSLKTQPNSIFDKKGVNVEFVVQDDVPTLSTIFTAPTAHCAWRTSDFWAQEQPNLRNSGKDGRAVLIVDNTQGADAVIAKDPNIKSIEDLAGKKVAFLEFTPSHGLLVNAIENSSLSGRKKQSIQFVKVNVEEGTAGVRAALVSGNVDAAVLWDPDLSLALAEAGAHVIYSTKIASNLIYDVIVCNKTVLDSSQSAVQAFVAGWLDGIKVANADKSAATNALLATEEMFTLLAKKQGKEFVTGLFNGLVLTDLSANVRILGLAGGTNHYERVYHEFDGIYRGLGSLANPNSPVINPSDSFDYRFVKSLMANDMVAQVEAKKPEFEFSEEGNKQAFKASRAPAVTKPVAIDFDLNAVTLSREAQAVLDNEVAPLIENYGSAYFEISGNTDSTGTRAVNQRISEARARAVVQYLVTEWNFPPARFAVKGNGPDKPLCDEVHPDQPIESCRAMNRTTRVAVVAGR